MNRKIDNLGRISIPKEMRDKIGLANGDEVKLESSGDKIILSNPNNFDLEEYIMQQIEISKDNSGAFNAYNDILFKLKRL